MIEMILVSMGGFIGSICRYYVSKKLNNPNKTGFPVGTLMVNLVGAFLLGFIYTFHKTEFFYILFGIGFLGSLTTFSTFMLEAVSLRNRRRTRLFYSYLTISCTFGILLAYLGMILGQNM